MGWGWWVVSMGQGKASREGKEALQFGLVFVESALAPGAMSAPPWPGSSAGLSQKTPGTVAQIGTWQHSQGRAGLVGLLGLRTLLGHQDGLLPYFQDVC